MKKLIWILIILAIIIVVLVGFSMLPIKPAKNNQMQKIEGIQITSPKPNEEISSPIKITGTVNGNGWSGFEGQVGSVSLEQKGPAPTNFVVLLGQAPLKATTEWTTLPTNFEADLSFTITKPGLANLVFHNENPSGDPAKDETFYLPVKLK